jgi:hypothetical protein
MIVAGTDGLSAASGVGEVQYPTFMDREFTGSRSI